MTHLKGKRVHNCKWLVSRSCDTKHGTHIGKVRLGGVFPPLCKLLVRSFGKINIHGEASLSPNGEWQKGLCLPPIVQATSPLQDAGGAVVSTGKERVRACDHGHHMFHLICATSCRCYDAVAIGYRGIWEPGKNGELWVQGDSDEVFLVLSLSPHTSPPCLLPKGSADQTWHWKNCETLSVGKNCWKLLKNWPFLCFPDGVFLGAMRAHIEIWMFSF